MFESAGRDIYMKNLYVSVIVLVFLAGLFYPVPAGAGPADSIVAVKKQAAPELPPPDPFTAPLPAKGKFLVATRRIFDPSFQESVVLLIGYGKDGAAGIIINRPTDALLAEMIPSVQGLKGRQDVVYFGGPVEGYRLLMLFRSKEKRSDAGLIFADVYATASSKALEAMISGNKTAKEFRVYSGYAGWRQGQLDRELARGDWLVVRGDVATIFEKKSSEIWPELMQRGSQIQVQEGGIFRFAVK